MKKFILVLSLLLGLSALSGCSGKEAEPFTRKDYSLDASQVSALSIDVRDRSIQVSASDDGQIHIGYFENSKEYYDFSLSDGTLAMSAASSKEPTDYVGTKPGADKRMISLALPSDSLDVLELSTTNEDISLSPLAVTDSVSLTSNGGCVVFDRLSAGSAITLSAKNGDISGSVTGSYEDFLISCQSKKGESNLPREKQSGEKSLTVSGNNGDINVEFVHG